MSARHVHSVIAAGLADPALLARWRRDAGLLRGHGVDPAELDLEALWKFAGVALKIRHNGLRADYPMTFRLLGVTGLEIEVFASYATFGALAGRANPKTNEQRAEAFLAFLEHWLDPGRREHVLLWDLFRHERALHRLGGAEIVTPDAKVPAAAKPRRPAKPSPSSVPRIVGAVALHEMQCDPAELTARLRERSPRLEAVALGPRQFCYWKSGAVPELRILDLDELGYYLISSSDGERTVAQLSGMLGARRPAAQFLRVLRDLAEVGILAFDRRAMTAE